MADTPETDLTPEEAKAYEELQTVEANDAEADANAAREAEEPTAAEPAEPAEPAAEPAPAPAETQAPAPAPAAEQPFDAMPMAVEGLTEADTARLEEIEAATNDLWEKFENGDLTRAEARKALDDLNAEKADLAAKGQQTETVAATDAANWEKAWNGWYRDHGDRFQGMTPETFAAFNKVVEGFTASDLAAGLSFRGQLDQSLAIFESRYPGVLKAKAPAPAPAAAPKAAKPEIPPTLASIPAADFGNADADGTYAALDELSVRDPAAFEARLAGMSAAQRDAYLATT